MKRRAGGRAAVALTLGMIIAAGTLPAQQASAPRAKLRSDSLVFIVEERIDGLGTLALLTRPDGDSVPILVDIVRSAITPQLVDVVLRNAERYNTQPADSAKPLHLAITRKTPTRAVPAKDKARIDAIAARLRRAEKRYVKGIGLRVAVAVPLRAGPQD
jgi:hypothetical protein